MDGAVVRTTTGLVRGVTATDHRLFAGIPYAAPPVGPLRWQPPAPVQPWSGLRDATRPGPRCIQDTDDDFDPGHPASEDCLTLNVWTPPPSKDARPVMVWIHGGGFINSSADVYDARRLTSRGDIVVVTLELPPRRARVLGASRAGPGRPGGQLRVGRPAGGIALGARQHRRLRRRSRQGHSGRRIRRWHIGVRSPRRAGLGGIVPGRDHSQRSVPGAGHTGEAEKVSLNYAATAGCGNPATAAQCLRDLPADKLHKAPYYFRFGKDLLLTGPITGTDALPVDPISGFADGRAARVPVLIGSNRDEATLFLATWMIQLGETFTAENYPRLLTESFGDNADRGR